MEVKSCFGIFWVNTKQTPDDLQQLFTLAASLKGKIQKILSIMRQWVEKWSIAPPISLPQPASPGRLTLFRIFKLPVFVLAVALGSHFSPVWKLILVSCHSQHFSGTSAKYIFTKKSVWFGEISLAHAPSQAPFWSGHRSDEHNAIFGKTVKDKPSMPQDWATCLGKCPVMARPSPSSAVYISVSSSSSSPHINLWLSIAGSKP